MEWCDSYARGQTWCSEVMADKHDPGAAAARLRSDEARLRAQMESPLRPTSLPKPSAALSAVKTMDLRQVSWLSPEELLETGFYRSRVVMVNEAHNGLLRCVRTREVGRRLLPVAKRLGVRHLAMEALGPPGRLLPRSLGYLAQPEMRALLDEAERQGIQLHGYEADHSLAPTSIAGDTMSLVYTNWREREQAANLVRLLHEIGGDPLLVWCGNSHHTRHRHRQPRAARGLETWVPMGWHFRRLARFSHFAIDQNITVAFDGNANAGLVQVCRAILNRYGGTAGFLQSRAFTLAPGVDAVLLSVQNDLR